MLIALRAHVPPESALHTSQDGSGGVTGWQGPTNVDRCSMAIVAEMGQRTVVPTPQSGTGQEACGPWTGDAELRQRMAFSRSPDAPALTLGAAGQLAPVHKGKGERIDPLPRVIRFRRCPDPGTPPAALYGPEASAPNPPRNVPSLPKPAPCTVHVPITPIGPSIVLPTNLPVNVPVGPVSSG